MTGRWEQTNKTKKKEKLLSLQIYADMMSGLICGARLRRDSLSDRARPIVGMQLGGGSRASGALEIWRAVVVYLGGWLGRGVRERDPAAGSGFQILTTLFDRSL